MARDGCRCGKRSVVAVFTDQGATCVPKRLPPPRKTEIKPALLACSRGNRRRRYMAPSFPSTALELFLARPRILNEFHLEFDALSRLFSNLAILVSAIPLPLPLSKSFTLTRQLQPTNRDTFRCLPPRSRRRPHPVLN